MSEGRGGEERSVGSFGFSILQTWVDGHDSLLERFGEVQGGLLVAQCVMIVILPLVLSALPLPASMKKSTPRRNYGIVGFQRLGHFLTMRSLGGDILTFPTSFLFISMI